MLRDLFGKDKEPRETGSISDFDTKPDIRLSPYPEHRAFLDTGNQAELNRKAALLSGVRFLIKEPGQELFLWDDARSTEVGEGEQGIELTFRNNEERIKYYDTLRKLENEANQESSL